MNKILKNSCIYLYVLFLYIILWIEEIIDDSMIIIVTLTIIEPLIIISCNFIYSFTNKRIAIKSMIIQFILLLPFILFNTSENTLIYLLLNSIFIFLGQCLGFSLYKFKRIYK